MLRAALCAACAAWVALGSLPAFAGEKARFLPLKNGQTTARTTGTLRGMKDEARFAFDARAGRHLTVTVSGKGPTRGMVIFPSRRQEGIPGGIIFDGMIRETGRYRVRVTESSMAEEWHGKFTLEIVLR